MPSCTNLSAYKFTPLAALPALRLRLQHAASAGGLKGTVLLSAEGINLFVAGEPAAAAVFVAVLRTVPGLEELTPRETASAAQPYRRMPVKIKKEIIVPEPRKAIAAEKTGFHPRNRHRARYDFAALIAASPPLARFVRPTPFGDDSVDFADPAAVLALNRALLQHDYGVSNWTIPPGYLCPPLPGRADYVHHVADLLAEDHGGKIPRGDKVAVLDIGIGANAVYPIIGHREYGWRFVGSDVDPVALESAARNIAGLPGLAGRIELRRQPSPLRIFRGVVRPGEHFAASVCNPPFHASAAAALAGARRKRRNLAASAQKAAATFANFGGQGAELWCAGGELGFIRRMIAESAEQPELCRWFTSLVSSRENLPAILQALRMVRAVDVRTIAMAQGQKKSRLVAWSFRGGIR